MINDYASYVDNIATLTADTIDDVSTFTGYIGGFIGNVNRPYNEESLFTLSVDVEIDGHRLARTSHERLPNKYYRPDTSNRVERYDRVSMSIHLVDILSRILE